MRSFLRVCVCQCEDGGGMGFSLPQQFCSPSITDPKLKLHSHFILRMWSDEKLWCYELRETFLLCVLVLGFFCFPASVFRLSRQNSCILYDPLQCDNLEKISVDSDSFFFLRLMERTKKIHITGETQWFVTFMGKQPGVFKLFSHCPSLQLQFF